MKDQRHSEPTEGSLPPHLPPPPVDAQVKVRSAPPPDGDPSDPLEYQLQKAWEELLEISPIGTHEDFFDLGGHSLMAASLFARIGQLTGCNLPLATLINAPTIAELAAVIREGGWETFWGALVPIQPEGKKTPLFVIHPVGGNVLGYHTLAKHLPADQPIFGLQAQGLSGTEKPLDSVEAMAAHYLKEIRSRTPKGPYLLVGYSSGGLVAYEMAQQLRAEGEKVPLLFLLDTMPFSVCVKPPLARFMGHLHVLGELRLRDKLRYLGGKLTLIKQRALSRFRPTTKEIASPEAQQNVLDDIRDSNRRAILKYRPKPYPGPVVLYRALQRQHFYDQFQTQPEDGWRTLVPNGLEVRDMPCDHGQVLGKANVPQIAKDLEKMLEAIARSAP